jgi:hypothetical protein
MEIVKSRPLLALLLTPTIAVPGTVFRAFAGITGGTE